MNKLQELHNWLWLGFYINLGIWVIVIGIHIFFDFKCNSLKKQIKENINNGYEYLANEYKQKLEKWEDIHDFLWLRFSFKFFMSIAASLLFYFIVWILIKDLDPNQDYPLLNLLWFKITFSFGSPILSGVYVISIIFFVLKTYYIWKSTKIEEPTNDDEIDDEEEDVIF